MSTMKNGQNKFVFLLDEHLQLSEYGKISKNLVDKILNIAVETNSYRDAAQQLMELLNISISHEMYLAGFMNPTELKQLRDAKI